MKISKRLNQLKTAKKTGNQKGVALVLVLTVMSLATIMILSFFSLATSENRASATYSRGLQAQQVAEQAVNMVIAQIRNATSQKNVGWASQPGALRTWSANGNFLMGYKLYSDNLLQDPDEDNLVQADFQEARNWASLPEEFVDLNEPVIRGEKVYFPIVDPLSRDFPEWPQSIGGETDNAGVEGFDFNFDADHVLDPGEIDQVIREVNGVGHLAMPVRWIYQLSDGTLGTVQGNSFVSLSGNVAPSPDNQIVARFAFWADDETTKLNLNTHAGGLAWDTPRAGGDMDMDMAKYQPIQKEWQRYPGHPATTHLVPALAPGVIDIVQNKEAMELIFRTVPRIVGGGSESGTRKANPKDPTERNGLIADRNPLFPSVDEFVMAPDRTPNYFPQASGRPVPENEMVERLERLRFFLTTASRAPETTLFNTPRIACWPITGTAGGKSANGSDQMTPFDELIAFCGTMGGEEYFFRRMNADSPSDDMYHRDMSRNQDLYNYLVKLSDSNIPGVGAAFSDKYGKKERYQIITQIFDYIRSTNLHDDSLFGEDWESAFQLDNSDEHITYTNPRRGNPDRELAGQGGIHRGHGQVVPIEIKEGGITTKGFGRFYTLKDVATHVICCADGGDGGLQGNFAEALGGKGTGDRNPGFRVYGQPNRQGEDTAETLSNFPPMPPGVTNPQNIPLNAVPDQIWPQWLIDWMDAYLNHEGEWTQIGTPNPPPPVPPQTRSTRIPKGNWRDRFNWRNSNNPRDLAGNQANWQEVVDIISPAFEPSSWNWNLKFNRTRNGVPIPVQVNLRGDGTKDDNTLYLREDITKEDMMRLGPNEKLVQGAMVFNLFCPSIGWAPISPDMSIQIRFPDYGSSAGRLKFVSIGPGGAIKPRPEDQSDNRFGKNTIYPPTNIDASNYGHFLVHYDLDGELIDPFTEEREWWFTNDRQSAWHHRHAGGELPFTYAMAADVRYWRGGRSQQAAPPLMNPGDVRVRKVAERQAGLDRWTTGRLTPLDAEYYIALDNNKYAFITAPFRIGQEPNPGTEPTKGIVDQYPLRMFGGDISFDIYSHSDKDPFTNTPENNGSYPNGELSAPQDKHELIQTINVKIPDIIGTPPLLADGREGYINEFSAEERQPVVPMEMWSLGIRGGQSGMTGRLYRISSGNGQLFHRADVIQSVGVMHGDPRIPAVREEVDINDGIYGPHFRYADGNNDELTSYIGAPQYAFSRMAHDMAMTTGYRYEGGDGRYAGGTDRWPPYSTDRNYDKEKGMQILPGLDFRGKLPINAIGNRIEFNGEKVNKYGDFDNGMGLLVDGPYINKPDEGNTHSLFKRTDPSKEFNAWDLRRDYGDFPYFVRDYNHEAGGPSYFSPNRIMSGPGMFGSLPSDPLNNRPWQTLLFRPHANSGHPGAPGQTYNGDSIPGGRDPADHYWMDLFWMPVVEPYAISEPLSTAGKVNLNYQILPFRNVKRSTAMRGIFRSELMVLIPTPEYDRTKSVNFNKGRPSIYTKSYKHNSGRGIGWHWRDKPNGGFLQGKRLRSIIQEQKTLEQFQQRFDDGKIFKTPSQICEVHLIPQQVSERYPTAGRNKLETYTPDVAQMEDGSFWEEHAAIGDNSREKPYTNIYNRITTKSNTFKVHYRGQVLKQGRRDDNDYTRWDPELDSVVGQYRGSSIVERYINPKSPNIPDYGSVIGTSNQPLASILDSVSSLGEHYRYRVVNPTRFAP